MTSFFNKMCPRYNMQVAVLCSPSGADVVLPLGEATKKELIVPASSIGKIIGRGGDMIRELQSRSQGKIQVDHTAKAFKSDTRLVAITGTPDAVKKAEEMILFLVANPLLDATMAIQMLVDDKQRGGQWGSGPPYLNMPNYGQNMAPVDAGFPEPYTPQQQYGGYQNSEPSYAYPPIPQQQQPYGNSYGGMETEIFPASKMYMGRIIGQKGVTINDLQKRSGCDIQINQDVPQGHDCLITIKGSRQGIEMVKQMLRDIIEMGPGHPYAGGGGRKWCGCCSLITVFQMT
jgi:far upstream element-binding protein